MFVDTAMKFEKQLLELNLSLCWYVVKTVSYSAYAVVVSPDQQLTARSSECFH